MSSTSVITNKTLSLLSQVDGRDKLYKVCQYGSRLAWWMLDSKGASPDLKAKLAGLDSSFSDARRVFRLGGFIKGVKDLLRDPIWEGNTNSMQNFKFLSTLCNTIGECQDIVIYGAKLKVLNANKTRWEWWRNCMWMVTILYAFLDQIVIMRQTLAQRKHLLLQKKLIEYSDSLSHSSSSIPTATSTYSNRNNASTTIREKKIQLNADIEDVHEKITNTIYTIIRYYCDFMLCSLALASREHKGVFGALGVMSGVLGLMSSWQKL